MKETFAALGGTVAGLSACDRFESAGPPECETLYDQVVKVSVSAQAGGGRSASLSDALATLAIRAVGHAVLNELGEQRSYGRHCKVKMTKGEVRDCPEARTGRQLQECGAL